MSLTRDQFHTTSLTWEVLCKERTLVHKLSSTLFFSKTCRIIWRCIRWCLLFMEQNRGFCLWPSLYLVHSFLCWCRLGCLNSSVVLALCQPRFKAGQSIVNRHTHKHSYILPPVSVHFCPVQYSKGNCPGVPYVWWVHMRLVQQWNQRSLFPTVSTKRRRIDKINIR